MNEFVVVVKTNLFVCFLGEFEDTKSPFEITWPLVCTKVVSVLVTKYHLLHKQATRTKHFHSQCILYNFLMKFKNSSPHCKQCNKIRSDSSGCFCLKSQMNKISFVAPSQKKFFLIKYIMYLDLRVLIGCPWLWRSSNTMKAYSNESIPRQYCFDINHFELLLGHRSCQKSEF